jgi:hypothetical protein
VDVRSCGRLKDTKDIVRLRQALLSLAGGETRSAYSPDVKIAWAIGVPAQVARAFPQAGYLFDPVRQTSRSLAGTAAHGQGRPSRPGRLGLPET